MHTELDQFDKIGTVRTSDFLLYPNKNIVLYMHYIEIDFIETPNVHRNYAHTIQ